MNPKQSVTQKELKPQAAKRPSKAEKKKAVAYFDKDGVLVITDKEVAALIGSGPGKITLLAEIEVVLPPMPVPLPPPPPVPNHPGGNICFQSKITKLDRLIHVTREVEKTSGIRNVKTGRNS